MKGTRELTEAEYEARIRQVLDSFGENIADYVPEEAARDVLKFDGLDALSREHRLWNTAAALRLTRGLLADGGKKGLTCRPGAGPRLNNYRHGLRTARILADLDLPLTPEETDLLLAASVTHVLADVLRRPQDPAAEAAAHGFDPRVGELVGLFARDQLAPEAREAFYARLRQNRLACLAALSDWADLVELLPLFDLDAGRSMAEETAECFLPACLYMQEHYPELYDGVGLLMGKVRCVVDVARILGERFREVESAARQEMLTLREDNARIRRYIAKLAQESG